jgi:phosphate transport system substrate-binding protein
MKIKLACAALAVLFSTSLQAEAFYGAGATFPNAVYHNWARAYKAQGGGTLVYTGVGSGKGVTELLALHTDFAASDKPLSSDELSKNKWLQFPAVIGGIVPIVNIKGIASNQLVLDGNTLAMIYLGKITRWNDPALAALNPGLALPAADIAVMYRSDKSGSTFNFTNYLSKANAAWKTAIGEGLSVTWKLGEGVDKSEGMAKKIASTPNAIGYIDLADAISKSLSASRMQNREGAVVSASEASFAAAASAAKWSASNNYVEVLTDQPGKASWPITAATFIVMQATPDMAEHGRETAKFFDWAWVSGKELASSLNYVPLPDSVAASIRQTLKTQLKDKTGKALY